jgi:hypothetical protein
VAIWFCVLLLWFGSLKMLPCGSKHVGMISVILKYKHMRYNSVTGISGSNPERALCRSILLVVNNVIKVNCKMCEICQGIE